MKAKIDVYSNKDFEEIVEIQKFLREDMAIRSKGNYNTGVIHPRVLNLALKLLASSTIVRSKISCSVCGFDLNGCSCDNLKALKK